MRYHDWRIREKFVDMLEPGYPDLVISDAIDITYGFESAAYPAHVGLLLITDHPLAADAVATTIMGYDPIERLQGPGQSNSRATGAGRLADRNVSNEDTGPWVPAATWRLRVRV